MLSRDSAEKSSDIRSVTVVIANLNCPILDQALAGLRRQTGIDGVEVETIVVGRDEPGRLAGFDEVRFIETARPVGPAVARNIAIRAATGDLVLSMDADCVPEARWISEMVKAHRETGEPTVIGGGIKVDMPGYWALADNVSSFNAYLPTRPPRLAEMFPTANVAIRRSDFATVGLFDEAMLINEDTDWMMRARRLGYRLRFQPTAVVWHRNQRSGLWSTLRHGADWGYHSIANRVRYADLIRTPLVLRHWWSVLLFSPVVATGVVAGMYGKHPDMRPYLKVLPVVWLAKVAWCIGAARRLWDLKRQDPA